ncbi:uncharacterized protein LOC132203997 [Neocloeon triangulifer]|uniref:uncharacterized protein LOC132203997 n=1 Tax=Neocloeon triangulifer TaxID=2078957 RepID=UPI00286F46D7|nr:uncharacterized protein LOC132203997 [Neocloeon triangulifer]
MAQNTLVALVVILLVAVNSVLSSTLPRGDCVERSLCYHSTDCCSGCCEENQCVKPENFATVNQCSDHKVARDCSTLKCPQGQECQQETRYCLIAPCPQPLPKCVESSGKVLIEKSPVPLPVQF